MSTGKFSIEGAQHAWNPFSWRPEIRNYGHKHVEIPKAWCLRVVFYYGGKPLFIHGCFKSMGKTSNQFIWTIELDSTLGNETWFSMGNPVQWASIYGKIQSNSWVDFPTNTCDRTITKGPRFRIWVCVKMGYIPNFLAMVNSMQLGVSNLLPFTAELSKVSHDLRVQFLWTSAEGT